MKADLTDAGISIEENSMKVIEAEVGPHQFSDTEWPVVRRVIHTTADFDFASSNKIIFSTHAIQSGLAALRGGCSIITDVNGVYASMNKAGPKKHGNRVVCKISDTQVMSEAARLDKTRSQTAMRMSTAEMDKGIVAIGNAPTALLEVIQMVREGARPALVVGIPVGFINAAESKRELQNANVEHITNIGRKGGSPVAASIINALYRML